MHYQRFTFFNVFSGITLLASFLPLGFFLFQRNPSLGGRIAGLIAYSYVIFYYCFCDSKHQRGYNMRKEEVRRELPRLLRFHLLSLVLLSALRAIAWKVSQHLPSSWLADRGPREPTLFGAGFVLIFFIFMFGQVYIFREILSRVDPDEDKPD